MSTIVSWLKGRYHYIALGFWVAMIIPTVTLLKDSILWVLIMSLYANIWISLEVIMSKKASKPFYQKVLDKFKKRVV